MKFFNILVISLSLLLSSIATANTESTSITANLPTYSKVYDDQRDPFKDAAAALALAKESNRQVLIEIGGSWCSWCHKMDSFLAKNPDVYKALHSQYVLLKISVSDSNENHDFMKSLPPVLGYPHMYVSTAQGKMILSKDTAELLAGNNYSKSQWLNFLTEWSVSTTAAQTKLATTISVE
ncbi:thioredoxin family protein [Colwellia sp. 75C3]|uniref:thioredoxin family protein n=1 Tax=Colwellia sp. 75C3 TaxID=888425 RepID=UPI000C348980|nr:thioredoxin family protein [Colwellia sp. 75C3]PKG84928.1 thioredoxin family protein [Colwellia sp. 75C3]